MQHKGRISTQDYDSAMFSIAPGSVVIVRDEEWLVTGVEHTTDGRLLRCRGLSELVRDTPASTRASTLTCTCSTPPKRPWWPTTHARAERDPTRE